MLKQALISFIGTGKISEESQDGYIHTEYNDFPNGKSYSSILFLSSYLTYCRDENKHIDKLYIIGTYTSDWASLLFDTDRKNSDLKDKLKKIKNDYYVLSSDKDKTESLIFTQREVLRELAKELEISYSISDVIPVTHPYQITGETVEDIYMVYRDIGKKLKRKSEYQITVDITHSLRPMPIICHQALSEYDIEIDNIIYGEFIGNKIGSFRDLSRSCEITKFNKSFNSFNSRFNLEPLSKVLKLKWPEMSEVLVLLNNVFAYSVMDNVFSVVLELEKIMQDIDNMVDKICVFEEFKAVMQKFVSKLTNDMNENLTNRTKEMVCVLNCGLLFIGRKMFTQASLANEAALQLFVMGRIFKGDNSKYKEFKKKYDNEMKRYRSFEQSQMWEIRNTRNEFAHNFGTLELEKTNAVGNRIKKSNEFLRKLVIDTNK